MLITKFKERSSSTLFGVEFNEDDFPLFAIIISKYNQTKKIMILKYTKIFDALKLSMKSRDKAKRNVLISRIKTA